MSNHSAAPTRAVPMMAIGRPNPLCRRRRSLLRSILLVLIAVITLASASCGDDDGGGEGQARFVLLSGPLTEVFHTWEVGAKEKAKELGVELQVQRQNDFEGGTQAGLINKVLATRPDALIVPALDRKAVEAPLRQATERGIEVVLIDSGIEDQSFITSFVAGDYKQMGAAGATALADAVNDEGPVLPISDLPGNYSLDLFLEGFEGVMKERGIELLSTQYHEADATKGAAVMRATLARHPDLTGVYAGSSYAGAEGVITALREAGKQDQVKVISVDGSPFAVDALKSGQLVAAPSTPQRTIAHLGVEYAYKAFNGESVPKEKILPECLLTPENLDDPKNQPCIFLRLPE
jgi:ribose transport system substrate-binding protein